MQIYFGSIFFQTTHAGNAVSGINNVIYMELFSGPKMANGICGKTIHTGTIDRGSTVFSFTRTVFLPVMWHTGGSEGHCTVLGHCDSECGFPFAALVAVAPG
jgi:hypothetical protein